MVPDAMYRNGTAFYSLKYCSDARVYFQELLRRYPKTEWKKDANEQLKKLTHDLKDKALCSSAS
jgi:TolA-binding protein